MYLISIYVRPHQLEEVKTALADIPVTGMSVSDARGCGNHPEAAVTFFGQEVLVSLPIRSKIEVAVGADQKEDVIAAVLETARTGEEGDGKIIVEALEEAIRIRTGETGHSVV